MKTSKYGAGHGIRTRDIQLGKLVRVSQKPSIIAGYLGKSQATAGPKRPTPARPGWDGGWDDLLEPLRRNVPGSS